MCQSGCVTGRVHYRSRRRRALNVFRLVWGTRPTDALEIRRRAGSHLRTIIRLTAATVLGYVASTFVTPGNTDLTAGLTAMLIVQATSVGTIRMGLIRVGAVLTGVLVAVAIASSTGLSWWSLALVVALSLLVARLLRLHDQAPESAISAMLILSGSAPDVAGETRVLYTLIGAAVGMALTVLLPPALPITSASQGVREIADETADLLDRVSEALAMGALTQSQLHGWLARARLLTDQVGNARKTISEVKQSRILNPRAIGVADVEPILRSGMDALEGSLLSVRTMLATLLQQAPIHPETEEADDIDDDVRRIFAVVISDTGECVKAFGELVESEAAGRVEDAENALGHSLEVLRETRAILTELMIVGTGDNPSLWVLRGSTLGAVEQIMKDLDLEARARLHRDWLEDESHRLSLPVLVRDTLIHPERPIPRGIERELRRARPALRQKDQSTAPYPTAKDDE